MQNSKTRLLVSSNVPCIPNPSTNTTVLMIPFDIDNYSCGAFHKPLFFFLLVYISIMRLNGLCSTVVTENNAVAGTKPILPGYRCKNFKIPLALVLTANVLQADARHLKDNGKKKKCLSYAITCFVLHTPFRRRSAPNEK